MSSRGSKAGDDEEEQSALQVALGRVRRPWNFAQHGQRASNDDAFASAASHLDMDEHFPTHEQLQLLPPPVRAAIERKAYSVIRSSLVPAIAVRSRWRARREAFDALVADGVNLNRPTASSISNLAAFARWSNLRDVAEKFIPMLFCEGEAVVHCGEPPATGLHLLGYGRVSASPPLAEAAFASHAGNRAQGLQRQTTTMFTPGSSRFVALLQTFSGDGRAPGTVVGDSTVLTAQPQRTPIRCLTPECVVWCLPAQDYAEALEQQDSGLRSQLADLSMAIRSANMRLAFTGLLETQALVRHKEFSTFDDHMLSAVSDRLVPRVVPAGQPIYEVGQPASSLFMLVSGTVMLDRRATAVSSPGSMASKSRRKTVYVRTKKDSGSPTQREIHPLTVFGGMSWMQNLKREESAIALTTVDVFCITRESVKAELAAIPIHDVPHLLPGDEDANSLRYLPYAQDIPFLLSAIDDVVAAEDAARERDASFMYGSVKKRAARDEGSAFKAIKEIASAFSMRIYDAGVTLCATAEHVDRLIIPVSGKAHTVGDDRAPLKIGECIGFPLLVPHRWAQRVVVSKQLEALELPFETYSDILSRHGLAKRITAMSRALLFPDSAKPDVATRVFEVMTAVRGPKLHPVTSLESIAMGTAPASTVGAGSGEQVTDLTRGTGAHVFRKPTEAMLRKLKPIPLRTGVTTCVPSTHSKSRIVARNAPGGRGAKEVKAGTPPPRLEPLVLGKPQRTTFAFGERLPGS